MTAPGSPLTQRIEQDIRDALRAGEKRRLGTLRLVLAAIRQREIDDRAALDDRQVMAILDKLIKQRRESVVHYQAGGRADLVEQETFEIELIQTYLPAALAEAEIETLIEQALSVTGAQTQRDMGKVMAHLKPLLQGRADMGRVSAQVKSRLTT